MSDSLQTLDNDQQKTMILQRKKVQEVNPIFTPTHNLGRQSPSKEKEERVEERDQSQGLE